MIPLPLRFGFPWLFQQGLHILAEGVVLPLLPLGLPIFRLQGGPPGGEPVHLGPEPFGGGQGYSVQAFQLSCRRLKQDDFALMPPEELLLVPGLAVFLIQGTELAIGGGVLHSEGQPLHFFLRCPEVRLHPGGGGRRPVAPLGQVLQTSDAMLRQEVQSFRRPLQILDSRPMLVAGALLGFEIVLDVDEQAGLPGALLGLVGGAGPSGDPGGQGLLGVVGAQGFQSGEPFLAQSPGGYVLAPFQLIPFPLEAAEQVLQVGAAGQEPVNGGTQLRLVAGAVLFRLMLNVALALVPAGNDDGQAMLFADPVAGAADEVIAPLIGIVVLVALKADRIEYHAPYILHPPRPRWDEPQRPAVHHGTFKYHHDAELLRSCGLCFRKGGDGQAGGVVVSRRFYYGFTTFQRQVRLRNAMICGVSSETQNAGNA